MRMSKMKKIIFVMLILSILMTGCTDETYEVKVNSNIEAAANIVGAGIYKIGEELKLAAVTKKGYKFLNWEIDGETVSEDQIYEITVDKNVNITANFEKKKKSTIEIDLEEKGSIELISNNDKTKIKSEAILDDNYELITLNENPVNQDKKTIELIYKQKNIDELIEKADEALGEKRWSDAGEYLLEAYNSKSIKHSKYNKNIEEFFSTFAMDRKNIIQALINEEITTKEDIAKVNWEDIIPEEPKLDILEREDKEIYEWFYKYFEFYGRIHSWGTESIWRFDNPLTSEEAYKEVQKVVLEYSENPVGQFLMTNNKLINNGIFTYQIGGADSPFIYDVFTMDDSKFWGLDKEDNKLVFEFKYTSEENWPDIKMNPGEKFKIEVEIHIKDDETFRVGKTSYVND
jgi:hypothetical protein